MHVLWTPSWYPSTSAPLNGSFFCEQQQMLRRGGHTVGTLVLDPVSLHRPTTKLFHTHLDDMLVRSSFPLIPLGVLPFDAHIIAHYACRLGTLYERQHGKPEVIHAHSAFPGVLVAQALSLYWDIPFVFTEHRPSTLEQPRSAPRTRAVIDAVRASSSNITVSERMAQDLGAFYDLPPFTAQALPVSPSFFNLPLPPPSTTFTFIHVSNMDRNKRVEETIRAFARLNHRYPATRLRLVGATPTRNAELQQLAHALKVTSAVELVGVVQRDAIAETIAASDCLVLVSAVESAGLVFGEAQAVGVPVIASMTAGGVFMTSPETAELVPIDSEDDLTSAMVRIMDRINSGDIDRLTTRQYAKSRFSEAAFVESMTEIYTEACQRYHSAKA